MVSNPYPISPWYDHIDKKEYDDKTAPSEII